MFSAGEDIKIFFCALEVHKVEVDACGRTGAVNESGGEKDFAFDPAGKEDVVIVACGLGDLRRCV